MARPSPARARPGRVLGDKAYSSTAIRAAAGTDYLDLQAGSAGRGKMAQGVRNGALEVIDDGAISCSLSAPGRSTASRICCW